MNIRARKGFTEPVALLSNAPTDLSPSGLAAFRVQPSEAASTYSRSVLGASSKASPTTQLAKNRESRKHASSEHFITGDAVYDGATPSGRAHSRALRLLDQADLERSRTDPSRPGGGVGHRARPAGEIRPVSGPEDGSLVAA